MVCSGLQHRWVAVVVAVILVVVVGLQQGGVTGAAQYLHGQAAHGCCTGSRPTPAGAARLAAARAERATRSVSSDLALAAVIHQGSVGTVGTRTGRTSTTGRLHPRAVKARGRAATPVVSSPCSGLRGIASGASGDWSGRATGFDAAGGGSARGVGSSSALAGLRCPAGVVVRRGRPAGPSMPSRQEAWLRPGQGCCDTRTARPSTAGIVVADFRWCRSSWRKRCRFGLKQLHWPAEVLGTLARRLTGLPTNSSWTDFISPRGAGAFPRDGGHASLITRRA